MDLSDVIASFASAYTVTRYAPSTPTGGRFGSPSVASTFSVDACVQPVSGRDLQRLPEGLRTSELLAVYSPVELKTQGATQDPDSIQIGSDVYEVRTVERWDTLGAYWKAIVEKVGH